MAIDVTYHALPAGRQTVIPVTEINDEDAAWFTEHNVKLSLEQLRTGATALYANTGNAENEVMVISLTKGCREMMAELRVLAEQQVNGKTDDAQ